MSQLQFSILCPIRIHADFMCFLHSFIPVFFEKDIDSGIPRLTAEGRKALEEELRTSEAGP